MTRHDGHLPDPRLRENLQRTLDATSLNVHVRVGDFGRGDGAFAGLVAKQPLAHDPDVAVPRFHQGTRRRLDRVCIVDAHIRAAVCRVRLIAHHDGHATGEDSIQVGFGLGDGVDAKASTSALATSGLMPVPWLGPSGMRVSALPAPAELSLKPARKSIDAWSSNAYARCSVRITPTAPAWRVRKLRAVGSGPA